MEQFTHMASIAIERTRSEEALKRSEALLAKAQRLSATGSFWWRAETDDIKWSQEAYRIFEFDPAVTMTPELIRTRVHPEDVPLFDEIINRARGTDSDFEYEHRLEMPDRSVKYLRVVAHGTKDQEGRVEYIGAIQDMTQRRLSEETLSKTRSELAHVARAMSLGALTASIAHEVNQPLSGIITNASTCLRMLDADPPDLNGARETARRTLRDGNRASDVITRLRALFGKKGVTSDSVDLNEATREVIALSRSELQRSRVTLRTELADGLPAVTGDRVQLQQVILNLLLNAAQAMNSVDDRSRRLMIRTEREGEDHVRLTVQDVGVGFAGKDVDRLFEAFYTTKTGGMGIGLSVSRSIIESHHGRLWAAPNDGPGATFSFSIPCVQQTVKGSRNLDATRTLAVANSEHL
jgi:signal transduction histidine kinase